MTLDALKRRLAVEAMRRNLTLESLLAGNEYPIRLLNFAITGKHPLTVRAAARLLPILAEALGPGEVPAIEQGDVVVLRREDFERLQARAEAGDAALCRTYRQFAAAGRLTLSPAAHGAS